MSDALMLIRVAGQESRRVELERGVDYIVGSQSEPSPAHSIVVEAAGVSRRHLRVRADDFGVDLEDLGSTFHTLLDDGLPITRWRVLRTTTVTLGRATLVIDPPEPAGDRTQQPHALRVSRFALRRTLVALCRDHIVHPHGRGSWVLSHRDLEELFGGSPRADQFSKDVQEIARDFRVPASAEALIDWAIATNEVGAGDVRWLDGVLREATGMDYDQRIRELSRFGWLRTYGT